MSKRLQNRTKDLNQRHTAWFQLVSSAGAFLDRFNGEINETVLKEVKTLHECTTRVMEVEGIVPISDRSFD